MKMFRRLAALTVAIAMVLVMLPAAVSAGVLPDDVKGTQYEDAASLLCALDIMVGDGNKFNPDNNVTRAEFAKILVTAMGLSETVAAFQPKGAFADVAVGEWYAPYVELAAQRKAINGYGDGNFGPNDNVTGYQAIKMGCFASGHNAIISDPIAGYPQEYYDVAQEYDFLKGITNVNLSEPLTRGQVAILIANIMKADMLKYKGTSSESGSSYDILEGVNLLSEKHDVYRFDGLVTANSKTGLFGVSTLQNGEVQIEKGADVRVFDVGESDIDSKVGTYVKAYYLDDEDSNRQTIVSYDASSSKNTKIDVAYDDIDLDNSTDSVVKYYKDRENSDKTTKIDIIANPSIIWNGSASSYRSVVAAIADAENMQAEVEFLDYDGDSKFDVVSITAYETYVVNRIDKDNYVVTDEVGDWSTGSKKNRSITMDVDDDTVFVTITDVDGEEYEFEDIAKGDTLSIAASEDGKVFDVKLSSDVIEGTIDAIGYKDGDMIIEVDGEDYKLTSNYFGYITNGDKNAKTADLKIKIGNDYAFNLDVFGNISWSDSVGGAGSAKGDFGFITAYAEADNADASINVKMFSAGSVDIYGVADTVKIDGDKYKGTANIKAAMDSILGSYVPSNGYYGDKTWSGVPVLFELDDNENIKYIDTPKVGTDEDKYTLQRARNLTSDEIKSRSYLSSANGFGTSLPLDSSGSVIQLPSSKGDINTAAKYSTSKSFVNGTSYYVQLFTTDPDSYKSNYIIVANGASGKATEFTDNISTGLNDSKTVRGGSENAGIKETRFMVITDSYRAVGGDDEEETIIIEGYEEGKQVTYTIDPEYFETGYILKTMTKYCGTLDPARTNTSPFMEGDVVKVAQNKDSKLATFVAPVFLISEKAFVNINDGGLTSSNRYAGTDIAVISEIDGTSGVASYLIDAKSGETKGILTMDETGRFVRAGQYLTWTEEDGYTGAYTQMVNLGSFKITEYDASKADGDKVSTGTVDDVVSLEDSTTKTPPSIVIMQFRGNNYLGMHIINL